MIISGMGELHLDIIHDRLIRTYRVAANVGAPRVSYRETIKGPVTVNYTFDQPAAGQPQFARAVFRFEPDPASRAVTFVDASPPDRIPNHFVKVIEAAVNNSSASGGMLGFPLIRVKVTLLDGDMRPVDSTELAFEAATSLAFRQAIEKAGTVLLEPVMRLDIITPEQNMGDVISSSSHAAAP